MTPAYHILRGFHPPTHMQAYTHTLCTWLTQFKVVHGNHQIVGQDNKDPGPSEVWGILGWNHWGSSKEQVNPILIAAGRVRCLGFWASSRICQGQGAGRSAGERTLGKDHRLQTHLLPLIVSSFFHFPLPRTSMPLWEADRIASMNIIGVLKTNTSRTSLAVQWLRLCVPNTGDTGSFPGQRTEIPHLVLPKKQKRTNKQNDTSKLLFLPKPPNQILSLKRNFYMCWILTTRKTDKQG